ncbi:MAG TPA: hypothetical protein VKX16_17340 [Chloroflexota bacterium]|nr:hypothetical protein [Chloroflexota bacterium]
MTRVEQLAAHVDALCRQHRIDFIHRNTTHGTAMKRRRTIYTPPVTTELRYAIALHEIGHIVGKGRGSGTRVEQEAAAWRYVLETSIVELSQSTYLRMLKWLGSYLRKPVEGVGNWKLPAERSEFWTTYRLIRERAGGNMIRGRSFFVDHR